MPHLPWKTVWPTVGVFLFAALAFAFDMLVPARIASGVAYLGAVLLALTRKGRRPLLAVAVVCSGLILVGYLLRPPADHAWVEIINRGLTLFSIWATVLWGVWYKVREAATPGTDAEYAASQQELKAILEAAADGIMTIGDDGRVLSVNRACKQLFGYEPREMIGQFFQGFCSPAQIEATDETSPSTVRTGQSMIVGQQQEFIGRRKSGGSFPIALSLSKVRVDGAGIVTAIVHDLSLLKEIQAQVERVNAQLQQKNNELQDFVCAVSHDLKGPLVTCKGFLRLLREEVSDQPAGNVQEYVEQLDVVSDRMVALIDDLLQLGRLGAVPNELEAIDTQELVEKLRSEYHERLQAAGATLELAGPLPVVQADRVRLREVFENLLDNAIKYGSRGAEPKITIGAEQDGDEIRFFVRDRGPGIAKEYHARIFKMFERLQSGTVGTGIGLAVVSRIIEAHQGRVWVESEPGQGATFWFAIPTTTNPATKTPAKLS